MGLVLASTLQGCDVSRGSNGGGKVWYIYTKLSDKLARDVNDALDGRIGPTSSWREKYFSKMDCSIAGLISSLVIYAADGFTMITLGEPESQNCLNAEQGGPAWPECMPQLNTAKIESV